ncbi:MAG TPA: pitrilysin family protein [Gammaproteobacteria bacterium]|nr:pitrilysin family protein [Gammaproteobacteria bacterium]
MKDRHSIKRELVRAAALVVAGLVTASAASAQTTADSSEIRMPDGVRFIEQVDKESADDIVIPYTMYELDNGLTVILHEDHSDPLIHVDVTYHVGSAREEIGKSGFAHFFEHMMFQGSQNVGDEEHFRIISEAGGTLNGTTNSDRTNYFETIPSNQLEKVLWLEADRMGFLLPAVTQQKFEVQRETVKNERGQNYDNRPYGLLNEVTDRALFPPGHPYSWQTIGYIEDLDRADLNDLKGFFLRWYGPNNAVLSIGGDLDPSQTLQWIVKYFGPIPRGPEVEDPVYERVTLDQDRYVSMEDRVPLPHLRIAWPTVHVFHEDEAPLDVLSSILGTDRTSLLYKNLVRDGAAVTASASHPCGELGCRFSLDARPNPASDANLADIEAAMRASLAEFEERGVEEDDLVRMKMQIRFDTIFGLQSVSGKVSSLASYATFNGTPNYTAEQIARYERVTAEDVMRVYRRYIEDRPAVIVSVVPTGQPQAAAARDNWTPPEREIPDYPETEIALREPEDGFDRSMQPPASDENPSIMLPEIWRDELANGIDVLGAVNAEVPLTAIQIQFEAGQRHEPLEKLGLASLTATMLNEATERSTNEELSNRLQKLGSILMIGSGDRFTTVTMLSLRENLGDTLDIAAERLFMPAFDAADFARVKDQTLQQIELSKTQASPLANSVFDLVLFGRDNSFAYPNAGLAETVTDISLDDVKAFYARAYSPASATVIAVSDIPQDDLTEALAFLTDWTGDSAPVASLEPLPELAAGTLYLVDKPDAAQSEIRIGKRALPYDALGEFHRSQLMNFALGGSFNSRINLNLREDKGYTYGARSRFTGDDRLGTFVASAGVRTDATAASIVEFVDEIERYAAEGITEAELTFTRQAIGQQDALRYETPLQKLNILSDMVTYDLSEDFIEHQNQILERIRKREIDTLAREHLGIDEMILVVVGDKRSILPSLEELEFPIVELDTEGNPL